ncbi:hypothetical protein, partial [Flavobacterium sp.]|uniref:hypothetical protein n=1 Tax=Flavobacterium sp. TaxID=239 RepID=UPI00374D9FB9
DTHCTPHAGNRSFRKNERQFFGPGLSTTYLAAGASHSCTFLASLNFYQSEIYQFVYPKSCT